MSLLESLGVAVITVAAIYLVHLIPELIVLLFLGL